MYGYCDSHIWPANSPIASFSCLAQQLLKQMSVSLVYKIFSLPPPPHLHVHFGSMQSVGSVGLWDLLSSELLVVRATETQSYGPITRRDESCEELQEQGVDSHWDRWCLQPFHVWYFTYHNTFRSVKDSVWYTWSSSAKYLLRQLMFPSWWHENLMRW